VIDSKLKMDEEAKYAQSNFPTKYVDVELNYMKEIRETYFTLKETDIPPVPPPKIQFP